jgi:hypothetical protein
MSTNNSGSGGTRRMLGPGGTEWPRPIPPPIPVGPGPVIPPTPTPPNPQPIGPLGPGGTQQIFNFAYSNLALMVGGQVLLIVLLLMIVFFGVEPLSFPANAVRSMVNGTNAK